MSKSRDADSNVKIILEGQQINPEKKQVSNSDEPRTSGDEDERVQKQRDEQNIHELKEKAKTIEKQCKEAEAKAKVLEEQRKTLESQLKSTDRKLAEAEKKYEKEKATKEQLLNRLSEVAGAKLSENNAAITDLSDVNRPQKLGEMFSEIYDNEWTEGFEELTQGSRNEEEVIKDLLKILQGCNTYCRNKANDLLEGFRETVTKIACPAQDSELPGTSSKKVKDVRKSLGPDLLPGLEKLYFQNEKHQGQPTRLAKYTTKCLRFCWYAAVQDPPVFLEFLENHHSAEFDTSKLKEYTRKGDTVDFVVWPVLYLHENGALLAKGVAQGKAKTEEKRDKDNSPDKGTDAKTNITKPDTAEKKTESDIQPVTGADRSAQQDIAEGKKDRDIKRDEGGGLNIKSQNNLGPATTTESNIRPTQTGSQGRKSEGSNVSNNPNLTGDNLSDRDEENSKGKHITNIKISQNSKEDSKTEMTRYALKPVKKSAENKTETAIFEIM